MGQRFQAGCLATVCVLLWGLIPVVAKFGQSELNSQQFLFWSSVLSFSLMALISLLSGTWRNVLAWSIKDWVVIACNGLLGTYVYYILLYQGYAIADGVDVLLSQYTWPVLICCLSVWLLKERWNHYKSFSLFLGFLAVVLVLSKGDFTQIEIAQPAALLWVLLGAFCFALFSVLSKKLPYEPVSLTAVYFFVATVASGLSLDSTELSQLPVKLELWALLVNGLFVNGISYWLWVLALRKSAASFVAPFTFATPLISLIYLLLFFDEPFYSIYLVAFSFIVASGLLANKKVDKVGVLQRA